MPKQTETQLQLSDDAEIYLASALGQIQAKAPADKVAHIIQTYSQQVIAGIDDKDGARKVQDGKNECVAIRSAVEKARKEAKAPFLEMGRRIDAAAAAAIKPLEDVEAHLDGQKEKLKQLEAARQAEIARKAQELFEGRVRRLQAGNWAYGFNELSIESLHVSFDELKKMTAESFEKLVADGEKANAERIERERVAEKERQKQAEADRIAREENERIIEQAKKDKEVADALAAEKERENAALRAQLAALQAAAESPEFPAALADVCDAIAGPAPEPARDIADVEFEEVPDYSTFKVRPYILAGQLAEHLDEPNMPVEFRDVHGSKYDFVACEQADGTLTIIIKP